MTQKIALVSLSAACGSSRYTRTSCAFGVFRASVIHEQGE